MDLSGASHGQRVFLLTQLQKNAIILLNHPAVVGRTSYKGVTDVFPLRLFCFPLRGNSGPVGFGRQPDFNTKKRGNFIMKQSISRRQFLKASGLAAAGACAAGLLSSCGGKSGGSSSGSASGADTSKYTVL